VYKHLIGSMYILNTSLLLHYLECGCMDPELENFQSSKPLKLCNCILVT